MNTVETTDPDVMPWFDPLLADYLSHRPIETEADLIAAAAEPGFDMELREFYEIFEDDELEEAHTGEAVCKICNGTAYAVAERERIRKEELTEYATTWDPTIRL